MHAHRRILVLGAVWVLLGVALGLGGYVRLNSVRAATNQLTQKQLPMAVSVLELRDAIVRAQLSFRRMATDPDPALLASEEKRADNALVFVASQLEQMSDGSLHEDSTNDPLTLHALVVAWADEAKSLLRAFQAVDDSKAARPSMGAISASFDAVDERLGQLVARELLPLMNARVDSVGSILNATAREGLLLISVTIISGCILTGVVARRVQHQQVSRETAQARQEFEARVTDALMMAQTEDESLRLIEEILENIQPTIPAELLLADSSRAHIHQAAATAAARGSGPMCGVKCPSLCPAVRRGAAMTFRTSDAFDVCPHLRDRGNGHCSATCVPVSVMGQQVGVMHIVTPNHAPPDSETSTRLTILAAKTGERIGVIRAFHQSEDQAARDTLTGALNRRSGEHAVQHFQRAGQSFCVAYADIDQFKRLNDTHGHETGDRALRLFSRVLTDSLRPTDVVARWGGEEFVILLPDTSIETAKSTLDRLRDCIAQATGTGSVPRFTVSFGLAECLPSDQFHERLEEADAALLTAKRNGRNQVSISGAPMMPIGQAA